MKPYACASLASQHINSSKDGIFSDIQKMLTFFNRLGEVVAKPVDGNFSKNVTTGITTGQAFFTTIDLSSSQRREALSD